MTNKQSHQKKPPAYPIESVNSVLTIIKLFQEGPLRLSDIAEKLGVAVSTAHRLLAMLKYHDMAEQNPTTKTYHPGPALLQIGLVVVRDFNLREAAKPLLNRLAFELGETVHLSIPRGTEILVIDSVESGHALRVGTLIGSLLPAHRRAAGLAYLSMLDRDELKQLYRSRTIPAGPDYEKMSRADLFKRLEEVSAQGYAFHEVAGRDIVAIAAAVNDISGSVKASIGLSLPLSRFDRKRLPGIADKLMHACHSLGNMIV